MTPTAIADGWSVLKTISDPAKLSAELKRVEDANAKLTVREKVVQEREKAIPAREAEIAAVAAKLEDDRKTSAKEDTALAARMAKFMAEKTETNDRHVAKTAELKTEAEKLLRIRDDLDKEIAAHAAQLADMTAREAALKAREDAVKAAEDVVAVMKTDYETKLTHLRSVAGTLAA